MERKVGQLILEKDFLLKKCEQLGIEVSVKPLQYLYGSLGLGGHGSEFLFTPSLNKQWDLGFLQQISKYGSDAEHVIIGDGAGFHHRQGQQKLPIM